MERSAWGSEGGGGGEWKTKAEQLERLIAKAHDADAAKQRERERERQRDRTREREREEEWQHERNKWLQEREEWERRVHTHTHTKTLESPATALGNHGGTEIGARASGGEAAGGAVVSPTAHAGGNPEGGAPVKSLRGMFGGAMGGFVGAAKANLNSSVEKLKKVGGGVRGLSGMPSSIGGRGGGLGGGRKSKFKVEGRKVQRGGGCYWGAERDA